jgi:hypothetical protein
MKIKTLSQKIKNTHCDERGNAVMVGKVSEGELRRAVIGH